MAKLLGKPFMPWQQLVADVGGELLPDGRPAYRQVIVTVPRQSGKTQFVLSWECKVCATAPRSRAAYSAQTGWDASKKLIEDQAPELMASALSGFVSRIYRGAGTEKIMFKNGSRIETLASTASAGHGKTLDLAVMDEIWADTTLDREQAIIPTMATKPLAQILGLSTAGTEASVLLNRMVDAGRSAVENGLDEGTAYFEWSISPDDDIDDEGCWPTFMPALGHTIDINVVRQAKQTMSPGEFARAFGNRPTTSNERVIPAGAWEAVCGDDVAPDGALRFAVCVTPEHGAASIVVADAMGRCELVAARPGLSWVVGALDALWQRHRTPVGLDAYGPTGSLVPDLEKAGVPFEALPAAGMRSACGGLLDAIYAESISVRRSQQMDDAVAAARKRPSGDAFVWSMSATGADTSPLVALTIAHSMAREPAKRTFAY